MLSGERGVLLPKTAPLYRDSADRTLHPWPFGSYIAEPGTVWVASTYNRGSYDSRYMGPISVSRIRARLRPLWTL
jgi:type IV secretory pathway protease TraF